RILQSLLRLRRDTLLLGPPLATAETQATCGRYGLEPEVRCQRICPASKKLILTVLLYMMERIDLFPCMVDKKMRNLCYPNSIMSKVIKISMYL
ncbi:unnamed protein product, partial [Brassica oleracea var. botrytis]